jgi:hypothetical protein
MADMVFVSRLVATTRREIFREHRAPGCQHATVSGHLSLVL